MSEQAPTPNHNRSSSAHGNHTHGNPDVLRDEAAQEAARPVMDVAERLRNARMQGEVEGTIVDELGVAGIPIDMLTRWGFNRALNAAKGNEVPALTETEKVLLDTFAAEAEMVEAESKLGEDFAVLDFIEDAMHEARERALSAETPEEKKKWEDIARHAWEYQDRAEGMADGSDAMYESFHELFNPNTVGSAGVALEGLGAGEARPGDTSTRKHIADAKVDAGNMRKTARLYELIAEMNPASQPEIDLEAQKKLELTGQIQETRGEIDPEMLDVIGGTADVSRTIYANMARLRRELAAASDVMTAESIKAEQAAWQQRLKGMTQYNVALEADGHNDLSELSLDDLGARQAFMAVWAETNHKDAES